MIKVWNYLDEYEAEKAEIHEAIDEVLNSGWLILGTHVKSFEAEFAGYHDTKHGIGVANATDGLFLSLRALGIGKGDEVITVSNTAVPTVSAIVATGATPVFVDIEEDSFLMDVNKIANVITNKTKCILPVHLFGQCVDMVSVMAIAKRNNLKVLEDCSQSHGAEYKGKKCGGIGDASVYSFYPTKPLGGYGDGGIVLTNDEDIKAKLLKLRFYGMEKTYYSVDAEGYNSRLDELHAAILRKKLKHLDSYIDKRRYIAEVYTKELESTPLITPNELEHNKHVYYVYVCRSQKRDALLAQLKEKDIHLNISYPWPIHTMSGFKDLGYKEGDLPITEKAAKEIFSLPMYPYLAEKEYRFTIEALKELT